ncbi:hypothetical protein, partial [Acinetobacter baumannii]|uniref:hypothetical protein n=1 Tax=Acinetobacter baumannii TaxID=470 RepID=UPI001BB464BF
AKVQASRRGGLAEQIGRSAGDELLALDDWRIKKTDDLAAWHDAQRAQTLLVNRDQRILTLTVPALSPAAGKAGKPARVPATALSATDIV